jgi:hypothetical protein
MKIFSILILLFNILFAQQSTIDSIIRIETKILKENNIKEFYFLEQFCTGSIKLLKTDEVDCKFENSKIYVFWKEDKECFFKSIDKCNSKAVKISCESIDYYRKHKNRIISEKVQSYTTKIDNVIKGKVYASRVSQSHSCITKIYFEYKNKMIQQKVDNFDLTNDYKEPNIYFNENNSLKLVSLIKISEELIK